MTLRCVSIAADHHADGQHLCFTMFPSSEHPSVGNDNTAGRSGFFINTVSSYAAPRRHKGGRRAAINHGGIMLMGNYSSGAPSFVHVHAIIEIKHGAPDFFENSVFCHHNQPPSRCGVRPHGHRGDTGGILY